MLEIRMDKATLMLTESELRRLLARDPELWKTAIRRGKVVLRARREARRLPKDLRGTGAKGAQKGRKITEAVEERGNSP